MIVAAITPYLDTVASLFLTDQRAVKVLWNVMLVELALTEHAKSILTVLLPKAFEVFTVERYENTYTEGVAINPKTLKRALIGPDQLSVTALNGFVVHHAIIIIAFVEFNFA